MEELDETTLTQMTKKRIFVLFGSKFKGDLLGALYKKLKILEIIILISALLSVFLAVTSCESNMVFVFDPPTVNNMKLLYNLKIIVSTDASIRQKVNIIRIINSVITLLIIIILIFHYKLFIETLKIKMILAPDKGLFHSGYLKWLLLEIFLNIWHTPPLSEEYSIAIAQRSPTMGPAAVLLDNILTGMLLFCRSYHIIKLFTYNSNLNNYECEKICLECNTPLNFFFLIKAEFKSRPFFVVGSVMVVSIFVFGYSLRSIEMFFMFGGDQTKVQDWRYYWNGLWCVIVTMSTVGFGDFYPISLLGRAIIVIACFWGTFLISLMVAALTVSVRFNHQQAASYQTINSAKIEIKIGKQGIVLIQRAWRYVSHVKWIKYGRHVIRDNEFRFKRSMLFNKFNDTWLEFRNLRKNETETIQAVKIEIAIKRINDNFNTEMDKIRLQKPMIEELNGMLNEYENNQKIIKQRTIELYKEIEEISIFKEKFLIQKFD